jgi:hypothetical protein
MPAATTCQYNPLDSILWVSTVSRSIDPKFYSDDADHLPNVSIPHAHKSDYKQIINRSVKPALDLVTFSTSIQVLRLVSPPIHHRSAPKFVQMMYSIVATMQYNARAMKTMQTLSTHQSSIRLWFITCKVCYCCIMLISQLINLTFTTDTPTTHRYPLSPRARNSDRAKVVNTLFYLVFNNMKDEHHYNIIIIDTNDDAAHPWVCCVVNIA